MAYSIYDSDRTVESLLKEFNRTQKNIIKALRNDNQKEFNQLVSYRNDIRHVIKLKENNNDIKDNTSGNRSTSTSNSSNGTKHNRPKEPVE